MRDEQNKGEDEDDDAEIVIAASRTSWLLAILLSQQLLPAEKEFHPRKHHCNIITNSTSSAHD